MASSANIVTIRNLTKVYAQGEIQVTALNNISLGIASAEFLALMGPSGSGKSTLLHVLGTLDRPEAGTLAFGDREVLALAPDALREAAARGARASGKSPMSASKKCARLWPRLNVAAGGFSFWAEEQTC